MSATIFPPFIVEIEPVDSEARDTEPMAPSEPFEDLYIPPVLSPEEAMAL